MAVVRRKKLMVFTFQVIVAQDFLNIKRCLMHKDTPFISK
jgi:hypothetical protein